MKPETALALVKKYAAQYGVREAARIFKIDPGSVSLIKNNKGKISGKRIAAKVEAAGTFTCPTLGIIMLPEVCCENQTIWRRWGVDGYKRDQRKLYFICPECPTGKKIKAEQCKA